MTAKTNTTEKEDIKQEEKPKKEELFDSEFSEDTKFFRSTISGLSVVVGKPQEGQIANERVSFVEYTQKDKHGDTVKFGYLATDDARAIKILEADSNVSEISEEDYLEFTDPKNPEIKKYI